MDVAITLKTIDRVREAMAEEMMRTRRAWEVVIVLLETEARQRGGVIS